MRVTDQRVNAALDGEKGSTTCVDCGWDSGPYTLPCERHDDDAVFADLARDARDLLREVDSDDARAVVRRLEQMLTEEDPNHGARA